MCKKRPSSESARAVARIFHEEMHSDPAQGIQCERCGSCVGGDGDPARIVCADCLDSFRNGAHTATTPCCFACLVAAAEDDPSILFDTKLKPITKSSGAYPDGFTCDQCGDLLAWRGNRMTK